MMFQLSKKEERKWQRKKKDYLQKIFYDFKVEDIHTHTIKILKKVYFSTYSINSVF